MSKLESFIGQVADEDLRRRLMEDAHKLKCRKRIGLVPAKHVPEVFAMPGLPDEQGSICRDRTERTGYLYQVVSPNRTASSLEPLHPNAKARKRAIRNQRLPKRFGEGVRPRAGNTVSHPRQLDAADNRRSVA